MTKKQYPPGATLNAQGTGRGMKTVNKPVTKKRGANATQDATRNRGLYKNLANTPVAEIAAIPIEDCAPLTDKAKLFVKFWAEGNSITTASMMAGYGDGASYAYNLVHRADVKQMYEAEKIRYAEAAQATKIDVMAGLKEAIDMAKLMSEPATMIAGWREIGKLCGYYEPRKIDLNVSVNGSVVLDRMNKMSDAELLKIINEASEQGVEQADLLSHTPNDR
jgi:hypothetical protein